MALIMEPHNDLLRECFGDESANAVRAWASAAAAARRLPNVLRTPKPLHIDGDDAETLVLGLAALWSRNGVRVDVVPAEWTRRGATLPFDLPDIGVLLDHGGPMDHGSVWRLTERVAVLQVGSLPIAIECGAVMIANLTPERLTDLRLHRAAGWPG